MSHRPDGYYDERAAYGRAHEQRYYDDRQTHDRGQAYYAQQQRAAAQPAHNHHASRARPQRQTAEHSYTIAHHGKQVRLGPVAFWICVGTLVVMAGWTGITATYFAFRDDVLTRLIARQAKMQFDYEDRLADLRSQVDRTVSRQLLDQEQVEKKLDAVMRRQSALETRANALASLPDAASITGSIRPAGASKPTPLNDTGSRTRDRGASLELRGNEYMVASASPDQIPSQPPELTRLQNSLDRVERTQDLALGAAEQNIALRAQRMRGVFAELDLDASRVMAGLPAQGKGGPFVPMRPPSNASEFERKLYKISLDRVQLDKLSRALQVVPIRKPIPGEMDLSSGFGARMDPFLGRPAMHTGLDFRADTGDAVHVTADGVVETAGWSGGYGRMIEINHGNGLSTRYGHLSAINVHVGERVRMGQVIGEVGSTGRSTGPHLHYETRIHGEAVNPLRFLRVGERYIALN